MDLDDKLCYCFHVTRRKLVTFIRVTRPKVPSQLSECGGAGTGCGWCVPFLKQLHKQAVEGGETDLERLTPAEYEERRAAYLRSGQGTPPARTALFWTRGVTSFCHISTPFSGSAGAGDLKLVLSREEVPSRTPSPDFDHPGQKRESIEVGQIGVRTVHSGLRHAGS